ncbi:hypothetical protein A2U01_0065918 [Trifolium medium]|uniref:Uncharacterized protein n=1 Tax=Trifolium medium TaxID=97028 RepID=A0A392S7L4_9FABA|nr:hypothetical protein [Trifolium medium]
MKFLQTHEFHEDNFLDTESFVRSRESREVKNGENLPVRVSTQNHGVYEESFLAKVFPETVHLHYQRLTVPET